MKFLTIAFLMGILLLPKVSLANCHYSAEHGSDRRIFINLRNVALVVSVDTLNKHFKESLGCHGHEKECAARTCFDTCEPFMHSEQEIKQWYDAYPKALLPEAISSMYEDKISSVFVCPPARGPIKDDAPPNGAEYINTEPSGMPGLPHHEFTPNVMTIFVTLTLLDSKHPNDETFTPDVAVLSQYFFRPGLDSSYWLPPIATEISLQGKSDSNITEEIQSFLDNRAFKGLEPFNAAQVVGIILQGK